MSELTIIWWVTRPSKGNKGAALVNWCSCDEKDIGYLLGDKPARYPVPAIIYVPMLEFGTMWEYIGILDDIGSSYPTCYRLVTTN